VIGNVIGNVIGIIGIGIGNVIGIVIGIMTEEIVGIGIDEIVGIGIEEIAGIGTDGMAGEKKAATGNEVRKTPGKVVRIPHKAQWMIKKVKLIDNSRKSPNRCIERVVIPHSLIHHKKNILEQGTSPRKKRTNILILPQKGTILQKDN
jgi:hypothetical protein